MKYSRLIILGSGPAGCTASIYSSRANLNPILIAGNEKGGQISTAVEIENWPGEFRKINGLKLSENMLLHASNFGTNIIFDHIEKVDFIERPFHLFGVKDEYKCDALIIATGAIPRRFGLLSERKYMGRGVSFCATCDGFLYRDQEVAVIGGGNNAIEESLHLANIAKKVYLIHRRDTFRAEKILLNRLMKKVKENKILLYKKYSLEEILGNEKTVVGIIIKKSDGKRRKELMVSGIFIAIGRIPNTDIFKNFLKLKDGYILTGSNLSNKSFTATSIPGIFAAGDVMDQNYCQAITAAGFGCMSAIDAEKYLDNFTSKLVDSNE